MSEDKPKLSDLDFAQGVDTAAVPDDGVLLGHARGESVLLVRRREKLFAISATSICGAA